MTQLAKSTHQAVIPQKKHPKDSKLSILRIKEKFGNTVVAINCGSLLVAITFYIFVHLEKFLFLYSLQLIKQSCRKSWSCALNVMQVFRSAQLPYKVKLFRSWAGSTYVVCGVGAFYKPKTIFPKVQLQKNWPPLQTTNSKP